MGLGFTQAHLNALRDALVTGAKEISIGDKKFVYQSREEILSTIKMIQAELAESPDSEIDPSIIRAKFSRGGT